jgi:hypothetical protein
LVLYHFALGAFEEWDGFVDLAGRIWDKTKRAHDPHGPFTVNIVDPDHPVTRGMDDFETVDELYTCFGGETPIHLLATARSKVDGQDYPMAFVLEVGQGRVFHTPLGHDVRAVTMPGPAELIRRGCLWAAGRGSRFRAATNRVVFRSAKVRAFAERKTTFIPKAPIGKMLSPKTTPDPFRKTRHRFICRR